MRVDRVAPMLALRYAAISTATGLTPCWLMKKGAMPTFGTSRIMPRADRGLFRRSHSFRAYPRITGRTPPPVVDAKADDAERRSSLCQAGPAPSMIRGADFC